MNLFKSKKAQSAVEMCICIPIFMVCIFGAFDLTLMISGLMDTMIIARDSLREMSLVNESQQSKINEHGRKAVAALASRAQTPFLSFKFLKGSATPQNSSQDGIWVQNRAGKHNSPHLVQVCSDVKLLVPWMWGLKNNEPMRICASYYMIRQFQPPEK